MTTWKPAFPEHKPFKCCAAWHLRKSGLYLAVYDFIGGLTAGGTNPYFSSIKRCAAFFDADYETTRRVFANLTKMGWLRYDRDGRKYWYVPHDYWEQEHPGKCSERALLSWQVDVDPFVGHLYAAAAGKFMVRQNFLIGMRKFTTDVRFLELFKTEVAAAQAKKARGEWGETAPKHCFWRVYKFLKEEARLAEINKQ